MNKVFIECEELIKSYKINKEDIIKQLEVIKIEKDRDFIIAYDKDFRFTLAGKMNKNNMFFASEISPLLQNFFPRHRWGIFM